MLNPKNIETVYIIGLGALGTMYAASLHEILPDGLFIIADQARQEALEAHPPTSNGRQYDFKYISSDEEHIRPADLIIIAVKSSQLNQAIEEIRPFVKADTIVLSLLNGITSETVIARHIGESHLLYAYAIGMDAVRIGRSTKYQNMGKIVFGEKINKVYSSRVNAVRTLFDAAGIAYEIPEDMLRSLWFKFMCNTGANQASAILGATYGSFQQVDHARKLMIMAAREVILLSHHAGIDLEDADLDIFISIMNTLNPLAKTSMLQDIEAGRETELDLFAGTVIELGKQYGIPTPVNETLHTIISAMAQMQRKAQQEA